VLSLPTDLSGVSWSGSLTLRRRRQDRGDRWRRAPPERRGEGSSNPRHRREMRQDQWRGTGTARAEQAAEGTDGAKQGA
jgi:hypothetical protein